MKFFFQKIVIIQLAVSFKFHCYNNLTTFSIEKKKKKILLHLKFYWLIIKADLWYLSIVPLPKFSSVNWLLYFVNCWFTHYTIFERDNFHHQMPIIVVWAGPECKLFYVNEVIYFHFLISSMLPLCVARVATKKLLQQRRYWTWDCGRCTLIKV